jgi:hypothetical protein
MASEITTNLRVQLANGLLAADFNPGRKQINQTGQGKFESVRSIATTETSVSLTGITTPHVAIVQNLDATNYCELGTTTTDYPIRLRPAGLPAIVPLNAGKTTLYLKANTAATRVLIIVFEE